MSRGPAIDYDALASQHGGTAAVDYDALAAQHGGTAASTLTQKAVSAAGQVKFIDPSERQTYQKQGYTMVEPSGAFYLQNIPGEDPLEEQKRYGRVRAALTPQERAGASSNELREFRNAGVSAGLATAGGVAGASALGPTIETAAPAIGAGLRAVLPKAGPTIAGTIQNVTKWAAAKGIEGAGIGGAWYLLHHLLGGGKSE